MTSMTNITHQGGLVFHVMSDAPHRALAEDGKDFYVVDLTSHNGHGVCDCRNFRINIAPTLATRAAPEAAPISCKHLTAALLFVGEDLNKNLGCNLSAATDLIALARRGIVAFIKQFGPTLDT